MAADFSFAEFFFSPEIKNEDFRVVRLFPGASVADRLRVGG
jgi:hypothetical protein